MLTGYECILMCRWQKEENKNKNLLVTVEYTLSQQNQFKLICVRLVITVLKLLVIVNRFIFCCCLLRKTKRVEDSFDKIVGLHVNKNYTTFNNTHKHTGIFGFHQTK